MPSFYYYNQFPTLQFPDFFNTYLQEITTNNLNDELEICLHDFIKFVQNIPMDKFDFQYQANKWTIKDIIQHLIDTERIFCFRALTIARNDKTVLASFDENSYAINTNANQRSLQGLLTELAAVRQATLLLFKSFSVDVLAQTGNFSSGVISLAAIGYIIIGHQKHHQKIFQERYL